MTKRAKPDPQKRNRIVTYTSLSPETRKALEEVAEKEHRNLTQQINHALIEWLQSREIKQLGATVKEEVHRTDG